MRSNFVVLLASLMSCVLGDKLKLTADNWAETSIKSTRSSFVWTINDYNLHNKQVGEAFESPLISSSTPDEYRWTLELYPKGHSQEHEGNASVYLIYKSGELDEVKLDYNVTIYSGSLIEIHSERAKDVTILRGLGHGWHEFYDAEELHERSEGKIIVYLEYFAYVGESQISGNCSDRVLEEHSSVLERLVDSEKFSDVELLLADGVIIRAHKNILAVQSPTFDALFDNETLARIEITDHEEEVVREALRFLYTGKVNKLDELLEKLFAFAVTYDIDGLRVLSESRFCRILDVENAIDILKLADRHRAQKLKKRAINFIAANVSEFLQVLEFKQLEKADPKTMLEIFNVMLNNSSCL